MKINRRKSFIIVCASIIIIVFIGCFLIDIPDKSNIRDDIVPSGLPDDDKIIIPPPPEPEEMEESLIDKFLDRLGIITVEDEGVPMAGLSFNARDVGMIPDDKSKASHNVNLLIRTLNAHGRIVIDDKYYITTPYEQLKVREVEITGTTGAELIADNDYSSKLFDPALLKSITIRNVKFTNPSSTTVFLVAYNENGINSKVEKVDIRDCTFTGNISLYRQYGSGNPDPGNIDFGIGDFIFKNNVVTNTRFSFIVLVDIPVRYCEISRNSIENFTYMFLNISISNDEVYSDKLYDHISYLKVEDNMVVCGDGWWGETSSGVYYTFVLFEGDEVLYNNNHVEGMKTRKDFAVYDAYLSANVVNYANNTWKNNICFAPRKIDNVLLKSKGGGAEPLIRNYTGNRFIVEEDFAERLGQSKNSLYVYFMSLTQYAESYNISDNLFDVYELRFPVSSMPISNFTFSGNTVRAKKSSGDLAIVRVNDGYDVDLIDISNNNIELSAKADRTFNLIKMVNANGDNEGSIRSVKVTNNRISAPFGYLLFDVSTDEIIFTDNTITDTGSEYPGFAYGGRFTKSNIADNNIVSQGSVTFYEGRQLYGSGVKREVLNILRSNYVSGDNGMQLDLNYNSENPTTYRRSYAFTTPDGTYEFYYTFTLSYDPVLKCAEVTFTNISGKTITYQLGRGNTSSNGHGQFIELVGQEGSKTGEIPFMVRFFNYNDSAGFYIAEYNSVYADLKVETISYEPDIQTIG